MKNLYLSRVCMTGVCICLIFSSFAYSNLSEKRSFKSGITTFDWSLHAYIQANNLLANASTTSALASYTLDATLNGQTINVTCGTLHDVYDSGGPGGDYGSNEDYAVTFCGNGDGVSFAFDATTNFANGGELFYVYDGANTLAGQFPNSPFNGMGLDQFVLFTSSGNCLTIRFTSNGMIEGAGWNGFIRCTESNTINTCAGNFYDSGGPGGNYSIAENSTTTICSDNGGQPVVNFTSFDIENNFEFLNVFDGATTAASSLGTFTGTTNPGPFTGTGTCLTFQFRSDGSVTAPGWAANISCIGGGPMGTADYTIDGGDQNTCMGLFTDDGEDVANYDGSTDYTATFCSDNLEQIIFTFSEFNTQTGSDLLYIYDGPNTSSPQLSGSPYSGSGPTNSPGSISSTGTCLTFRFDVNNDVTTGLGWQADITCSGSGSGTAAVGPNWGGTGTINCGSTTEIGGTVYDDFNNDGARGPREPGIKDIEVVLFDDSGQVTTTTTDVNGEFSFTGLTVTQVYRLEYTVSDFWEEGAYGPNSGTSVQFIESGKCDADLGLIDKARVCTVPNPRYLVPCYINGDPSHPSNTNNTSVASFLYNDSGNSPAASYQNYATMGAIGTVWGAAYDVTDEQAYFSAFLKRHAGIGPGGIGAIYSQSNSGSNSSASVFYDFGAAAGTVASNATRFPGTGNAFGQEGPCGTCDNIDPTTFGQVGKVGFGGMEMSPDNDFVYVTNLKDRKVYRISTNSPAPGSAVALPAQPWLGSSGCNGVSRPFGLKYYRGKIYVGVICDGASSACNPTSACGDLEATVYAYDGSSWSTIISFPLNYYRRAYQSGSNYWVRWMDNWNQMAPYVANRTDAQFAQPIFAGIEFDDEGSLVMSFADRTSFQLGYQAPAPTQNSGGTAERNFVHGDILRAAYNPGTESFTLENNGVAGSLNSTNPSSTSGPGGKSFYWGDFWYGANNDAGVGSMALLPGTGEVMFSLGDPIDPYANGIAFISNTNGKSNRRIEVYQGSPSGNSPTFAKSGGLGQIVPQCEIDEVEIGNFVWWDTDLDGLMDPSEPGIPGVLMQLFLDPDGNTQGNNAVNGDEILVATTTTDALGRYIFSKDGASNGLNAQNWQGAYTEVETGQTYQVRIVGYATDPGLVAYAAVVGAGSFDLSPTQNQGATGTLRDNNAYDNPGNAGVAVLTGISGENDHNFDFAFGPACTPPDVMPIGTTPCVDDDLSLMANASGGVPPYTYNWSGPNTFSSTDANPTISNVTLATAGNYMLTVTDDVGCEATFVLPIVVNQIVVSSSSTDPDCGMPDGSIDLTVTTGLAPISYLWSDGPTTEDRTNIPQGSYTVTVTDANGCMYTETFNLAGAAGPSVSVSSTDPTCSLSNGSITVTPSGGTPPYSITWDQGGVSGLNPTGLAAGMYSATVFDNNACESTLQLTLITTTPPSLSETHTDALCGVNNGSIDISVADGTAPFTFNWTDLAGTNNGEDRTGLTAGTYDVIVTDGQGCTDNISVTINAVAGPTLTVAGTDETCTASNGSIDLTVNNGTAPFTYDWDYDGTGDNDDPQDPTGLSAGTYTVIVTDDNACTDQISVTLTNTPGITELQLIPVDATSCVQNDGSIGLTVIGGTPPYAYDWDNDGDPAPDYDSEDLTGLNAGTYTVTVTDANGCTEIGVATVNLQIGASLDLVVTDPTTCAEMGSIDLTITGGASPYTINWSNGETTEDISGLDPGIYTVTVTASDGCEVVETNTIRDIREPVLNVSLTEPTCGMTNGAIDLTITDIDGTGPYSINWDDGPTSEDRAGLPAGIYTVTVENSISCVSSLVVNLNAASAPEITIVQTNESCTDGNGAIDMTITGGMLPYTIDWDVLPDMEDHVNLSAGTYSVTVTDGMGCLASSVVELVNNPGPSLTANIIEENCEDMDGMIDLVIDGIGPFIIDWDVDGTGDNDDDEDLTGLNDGTYTVTVTDMNGCSITETFTIGFVCPCDITITASDISSCSGGMFNASIQMDWIDGPTSGDFEYSIDGSPFQTLTRTNFAANATDEILIIPGLVCNVSRLIEIRFEGIPQCFEQVLFVFPPSDPAGYIYCVETGEVLAGGTISVFPPAGGSYTLIDSQDGTNGFYSWVATGSPIVEGLYTMGYTPPLGYTLTGTPGGSSGDTDAVLDPTFTSEDNMGSANPLELGSAANGPGTMLLDFSPAANPFYFDFMLELNDPFVELNNLPVSGCNPCSLEAGMEQTICSTATVDLTNIGASISAPSMVAATWSTSGTGTFDDTNMSTGVFGTATAYIPSTADVLAGDIVLTLSADDPASLCEPDEVTILILKVDCGTFPWNGSN